MSLLIFLDRAISKICPRHLIINTGIEEFRFSSCTGFREDVLMFKMQKCLYILDMGTTTNEWSLLSSMAIDQADMPCGIGIYCIIVYYISVISNIQIVCRKKHMYMRYKFKPVIIYLLCCSSMTSSNNYLYMPAEKNNHLLLRMHYTRQPDLYSLLLHQCVYSGTRLQYKMTSLYHV